MADANPVSLDNILSHFECDICFRIIEDPRNLPCGHTFCGPKSAGKCLKNMVKHGQIHCPLRCKETAPASELDQLPVNYKIKAFVEKKGELSVDDVLCVEHQQKQEFYCNTDGQFICTRCLDDKHDDHRVKSLRRQVELGYQELGRKLSPIRAALLAPKCDEALVKLNELTKSVKHIKDIDDEISAGNGSLPRLIQITQVWKQESEKLQGDKWFNDISDLLQQVYDNLNGTHTNQYQRKPPSTTNAPKFKPKSKVQDDNLKYIDTGKDVPCMIYKGHGEELVATYKDGNDKTSSIQTCSLNGNTLVGQSPLISFRSDILHVEACCNDKYLVAQTKPDSLRLYSADLKESTPVDMSAVDKGGKKWNCHYFRGNEEGLWLMAASNKFMDGFYKFYRLEKDIMIRTCKKLTMPKHSHLYGVWQNSIVCGSGDQINCVQFKNAFFDEVVANYEFKKRDNPGVIWLFDPSLLELGDGLGTTVVVKASVGKLLLLSLPTLQALSLVTMPEVTFFRAALTGGRIVVRKEDKWAVRSGLEKEQ